VLVNQYSFSNAEVFSHAIQQLGRGLLVGWPTAGGVISTGGRLLADGSYVSLPLRGWWGIDPDTGSIEYNLEGTAATPEVMVDLLPSDIASGKDLQLEAAVETLTDELGPRP
jgi:tricorn protease